MKDLLKKEWLCEWDFKKYEGIIISGSPITLNSENEQEYLTLFPFLWKISSPILWICFGHQLIWHTFWCSYFNKDFTNGEVQVRTISKWEPLFSWIKNKKFHENHEQHISLPVNFKLLAYSDTCKNEAMKHISKDIYGVQFHPEISWSAGKKLLENFLGLCKKM